jgi:hypothetical protein
MFFQMIKALPYRVGRTLKPSAIAWSLLSRKNIHKSLAKKAEMVGVFDVFI